MRTADIDSEGIGIFSFFACGLCSGWVEDHPPTTTFQARTRQFVTKPFLT